ncbi:WD40 repeat domain-containing protein [Nocardia salmonicida]|uniref:WD40 repeat domain-containing protein n=1 Tax=Nocardia salmonicida TaxID=53431 RepID=UPI00340BCCC8
MFFSPPDDSSTFTRTVVQQVPDVAGIYLDSSGALTSTSRNGHVRSGDGGEYDLGQKVIATATSAAGVLAVATADGILLLVGSGSPPVKINLEDPKDIVVMAISPDGKLLATGNSRGQLVVWDISDPGRPEIVLPHMQMQAAPVTAVTFSPDGRFLAAGDTSGLLLLWSPDPSIANRTLIVPTPTIRPVTALSFSPSNTGELVIGDTSGTVSFMQIVRGGEGVPLMAVPKTTARLQQGAITSLAYSADGKLVVVGGRSGTTVLFPGGNRSPESLDTGPVVAVSFSGGHASDKFAVATTAGDVEIWSWNT